jgi:L-gulonate 5-dehydrogenase
VAGVPFTCDGYMAMRKQLKVVASRLQMNQFVPVMARFGLYLEHARRMITGVFSFDDTLKAFLHAAQRLPETGKVILRFNRA